MQLQKKNTITVTTTTVKNGALRNDLSSQRVSDAADNTAPQEYHYRITYYVAKPAAIQPDGKSSWNVTLKDIWEGRAKGTSASKTYSFKTKKPITEQEAIDIMSKKTPQPDWQKEFSRLEDITVEKANAKHLGFDRFTRGAGGAAVASRRR